MVAGKTVPETRRVSFWCRDKGRMVTVKFACPGSFLFRKDTEILSCSAFEDPGLINCRRGCLDPSYRASLPDDWQGFAYWKW